jgi:hypothetical protein
LQPITGHQYSELVVSLSVRLYIELGCGFRGVVKVLSVLGQQLGWEFPSVPHRNSIENWVKKSGFAVYKEPGQKIAPSDYAMIVDESMMIGSEKLLLTLGVKATKNQPVPVGHQDVEVLGISVKPSWNSRSITEDLQKSMQKMKATPRYIISDNCSSLTKGIKDTGVAHIRDVSHTLGMFLERIYKNDPEFTAYMKAVSGVRFQHIMNPIAYLLPPAQRTMARFLNLTAVAEWSARMLENFHRLTAGEQRIFGFVPRYAWLIGELSEVLSCVNQIQREIKCRGLSHQTIRRCQLLIDQHLCYKNDRVIRLIEEIRDYLKAQVRKMGAAEPGWNASSDVIESLFGTYKARKASNKLYGVTSFVLILPLKTRINSMNTDSLDFKKSLESVSLAQIKTWEKETLTENLVTKRNKALKYA